VRSLAIVRCRPRVTKGGPRPGPAFAFPPDESGARGSCPGPSILLLLVHRLLLIHRFLAGLGRFLPRLLLLPGRLIHLILLLLLPRFALLLLTAGVLGPHVLGSRVLRAGLLLILTAGRLLLLLATTGDAKAKRGRGGQRDRGAAACHRWPPS